MEPNTASSQIQCPGCVLLLQQIAVLQEQIAVLQERIAALEAQLNQNSKNSSKPPSSDQKANLPLAPKKEKRPFHAGASRQLLPESMVTSREERKISSCPNCHGAMISTGKVVKWQQIELPQITPLVHQWELHECRCVQCECVVQPQLTPSEQFLLAPRLEAFVNLSLSRFRQSHLVVREFIAVLMPMVVLSQGLISKVKERAARVLEAPAQEIMEKILKAGSPIHVDATSWRHCGINEQAIIVRTMNLVAFHCVTNQRKATLASLLPGKQLHLVTDRALSVGAIDRRTHQYCLAHLIRNVRGLAEHPATTLKETANLGELYDELQRLFIDKHRLDRGEISESTWRQYAYLKWQKMKEVIDELLRNNPGKKVARFLKRLLSEWRHFMVYLRSRDHPMTNNPAEEALRSLVIARKLCFGSRSEYGKKWRAAIQSCVETLLRQGRSILDFLAEAIWAERSGSPYSSSI